MEYYLYETIATEQGVEAMKQYVRPEILVTYTIEELTAEAAVCMTYDPIQTLPDREVIGT